MNSEGGRDSAGKKSSIFIHIAKTFEMTGIQKSVCVVFVCAFSSASYIFLQQLLLVLRYQLLTASTLPPSQSLPSTQLAVNFIAFTERILMSLQTGKKVRR